MKRLNRWLLRFAEWAAWKAWNYARKRAVRREKWHPTEAQDARDDQSPEQRRFRANEARQVLENRHFIGAWEAMAQMLEAQMLSCDPDNRDKVARIAISKQLLHGLKREFERKVSDGYMAEAELDELNRRSRPVRMMR